MTVDLEKRWTESLPQLFSALAQEAAARPTTWAWRTLDDGVLVGMRTVGKEVAGQLYRMELRIATDVGRTRGARAAGGAGAAPRSDPAGDEGSPRAASGARNDSVPCVRRDADLRAVEYSGSSERGRRQSGEVLNREVRAMDHVKFEALGRATRRLVVAA